MDGPTSAEGSMESVMAGTTAAGGWKEPLMPLDRLRRTTELIAINVGFEVLKSFAFAYL
jgi:hypothetical protein